MEGTEGKVKVTRTLEFGMPEPATVFRIAWYTVASKPGVILTDESEAESQTFEGKAVFSTKIDNNPVTISMSVEGAKRSAEITAWGEDEEALGNYTDEILDSFKNSLEKYEKLEEDKRQRARRALVSKTCWDRLVHKILSKAPTSDVYFQLAHGREMMIEATKGEEMHPINLTTAGWLTKIESLPREEVMPAGLATELAKKSIDWKKETLEVIQNYL